jgi:hypothetical protein
VLGFHRGDFGFNVMYRPGEPFQCVLKACEAHNVQPNIIFAERQTVTPASSPDESPMQHSGEDDFCGSIFDLERMTNIEERFAGNGDDGRL